MSTTARRYYLKLLYQLGVKSFVSTSGLNLPFVCYPGDLAGEGPFYAKAITIPELAIISSWCRQFPRPQVIDIGANNGFLSTQLAQLLRSVEAKIYAVEPVPDTFALLKSSISKLGLVDCVQPICCAVSDAPGLIALKHDARESLFAQAVPPGSSLGTSSSIFVSAITVDQLMHDLAIRPNLIKIDVEGFEPKVLSGAQGILASSLPPAITLEWNPATMRQTETEPRGVVRSLGRYKLFYIDDFEGQRLPFAEPLDDLTKIDWTCNVFALPNERDAGSSWECAVAGARALMSRN